MSIKRRSGTGFLQSYLNSFQEGHFAMASHDISKMRYYDMSKSPPLLSALISSYSSKMTIPGVNVAFDTMDLRIVSAINGRV